MEAQPLATVRPGAGRRPFVGAAGATDLAGHTGGALWSACFCSCGGWRADFSIR